MEAIIGAGVGAFLLMLAIIGFLVYVRGEKEVKGVQIIGEFVEGEELIHPGNEGEMFRRRASNASANGYASSENGNNDQEGGVVNYGTNEYGDHIVGIVPWESSGNEVPFGESIAFVTNIRTGEQRVVPTNYGIIQHGSFRRKQRRRRSRKSKRV